jgi:hypothetical protein
LPIVDFRLLIDSGAIRHTAFSIDNWRSPIDKHGIADCRLSIAD